MSTNKNATIRYQALDRCFRNPGRKYYIDDLIEACNEALLDIDPNSSGVKKRQIYEDIKFMQDSRGFDAPIESFKEGRNAYYRYTESGYSINSQPLNEQEAQQLKESLLTLSRFKGLPQFEWVEEIKARLEQDFKLKSDTKVISFEENQYLTGREFIGALYQAIVNRTVLNISYKPFRTEVTLKYKIHPYYLKQYNNRWFLWGLNEQEGQLSNIALDRISTVSDSNNEYIINEAIDFEDYFEDVVGVSVPVGKPVQKVTLKIDPSLWPYVKTKPIHGSQKVLESNSAYTIIQIEVIPNYELESIIFSHAEKIEVLSPLDLRSCIVERIKLLTEKYF